MAHNLSHWKKRRVIKLRPAYFPPESKRDNVYCQKSDIYSLGQLFLLLLSVTQEVGSSVALTLYGGLSKESPLLIWSQKQACKDNLSGEMLRAGLNKGFIGMIFRMVSTEITQRPNVETVMEHLSKMAATFGLKRAGSPLLSRDVTSPVTVMFNSSIST